MLYESQVGSGRIFDYVSPPNPRALRPQSGRPLDYKLTAERPQKSLYGGHRNEETHSTTISITITTSLIKALFHRLFVCASSFRQVFVQRISEQLIFTSLDHANP